MTPIEAKLWDELGRTPCFARFSEASTFTDLVALHRAHRRQEAFACGPQIKCGRYRVDFGVISMTALLPILYAIECDGHDFHEKTKEQVARDRSRERALQAAGIRVVRFAGSEIWNEHWWCVQEFLAVDRAVDGNQRFVARTATFPSWWKLANVANRDPKLSGRQMHLIMYAASVADESGIARLAPSDLEDELGVGDNDDDLKRLFDGATAYMSCRAIDTCGRLVIRLREWSA